jgi:hypothetical protein
MLETLLRIVSFPLGLALVLFTLASAVRTFVLPRSSRDPMTRFIFVKSRHIFDLLTRNSTTYEQRDRIMALYAPVTLLCLPAVWLMIVAVGYTLMYWATGIFRLYDAFRLSGSSLLTLGFEKSELPVPLVLSFSEAAIGLILAALLIAYLPTMYSAFSQRESLVAMLEVRAGSPPFCVEMMLRYHRLHSLESLHSVWEEWERWFVYVDETHTSLAALTYFRSPQSDRSWVTAAGAVLDSAAMAASVIDIPRDSQCDLCIRAGYIALRHICDFFQISYNTTPTLDDGISVSREEFDEAYDDLVKQGVPVVADRDKAWRDFAGWRVNYDVPLLSLAALTMAPYAPWSSDRSLTVTPRRNWVRRTVQVAAAADGNEPQP